MRGLLAFALFMALLIFMMPFILGFLAFVALAIALFILLARLGLLPGSTVKTYTVRTEKHAGNKTTRTVKSEFIFQDDATPPDGGGEDGWYQSSQEGEVITLPETALKKDDEEE